MMKRNVNKFTLATLLAFLVVCCSGAQSKAVVVADVTESMDHRVPVIRPLTNSTG